MKQPGKICVVGCKHTTRDFMAGLIRRGIKPDMCLTIDEEEGSRQKVAGYYDVVPFCEEHDIPVTTAKVYSLKQELDGDLAKKGIAILLVIGWQRLIPDWMLNALSVGAFGMHGSNKPLPHGRGRSPMNWSVIQGRTMFFTHLFKYLPGVDDGPIAGCQTFEITPHDTCLTLHHKNLLAMLALCERVLPCLLDGTHALTRQPKEGVCHYPKRSAEDGLIHWELSSGDIYNLIRAVTKPFPGAFTYLDDNERGKLVIWRAIPFDSHLLFPKAAPGEIVEVFYDGTFIVRTGDTSLLVQEYEGPEVTEAHLGLRLTALGQPRRIWENLPF